MLRALITVPKNIYAYDFVSADTVKLLEEHFEVIHNELGRAYTKEELTEFVNEFDIIITSWGSPSFIDGPLHECKRLKLIAHMGGSVGDLVDDEAYERGITVISGNRLFAESVAEGTVGYIISALRRIPTQIQSTWNGGWRSQAVEDEGGTRGILDREIGLIGFGMIAKALVGLLRPFRCKFKVYAHYKIDEEYLKDGSIVQVDTLEELFSTCSVVSLHSALNERTVGMITGDLLRLMPERGVFVNTARGAIVKEEEITEVLRERPDIFAVLDVYKEMPLPTDSPLRNLPNAYLMPYKGGPTRDRRPYIGRAIAEECVRFAKGEPLTHEIPKEYSSRMTKQNTPIK